MRLVVVLVSALVSCSVVSARPVNLEFDDGVSGWRTVLDGVMGGRSTGRVTQAEPGVLRFSGALSLENDGGFSQMRTPVREGSLKDTSGLELRVRGDGRTYRFDIRCSDVRLSAGSFQAEFDTVAGEWITLRLPFDRFRLYSFGRLVPAAPKLTPARVESIGVTLADKQPGAFQLDVDFIRADQALSGVAPSSAEARNLIELAVNRAVPLFNQGNPEACAAIYEVAMTALVDLAPQVLGNEAVGQLERALAEGQVEKDPSERAWMFRRALDQVSERLQSQGG